MVGRIAALALMVLVAVAGAGAAQELSGLARVDARASRVADEGRGLAVELALSQPVPWRLYTLDGPPRLVIDFREADFGAARPEAILEPGRAAGLRFGPVRSGWSRLVVDLARPLGVTQAGMTVDSGDGTARLRVRLDPVDPEAFAAAAGAPADPGWAPPPVPPAALALPAAPPAPPPAQDDRFIVAIDPGHGGIDPGAERGGLREAHLMLALGIELAEAVARAGMVPVLTRTEDVFVPLQTRMSIARAAGADVLISLHADALEEDQARGASVYTLTQEAVDGASARMVQRHEGGDLIAGLDLSGTDDTVATALLDLARRDTAPRAARLAETLAASLHEAGAVVNGRPLRQAQLAVLSAADFPSVLLEAGFLSDEGDRARLSSPEGRAPIVAGIVGALQVWRAAEAARAPLLRR
jgi:N-acetylmuramoyl-L-alanine amidase